MYRQYDKLERQEEEQDEAQEEAFAVDPARGHHLDISL